MNSIILAVILTLLPLVELRGGLPVALLSARESNIPELLVFSIIVLLNILLIFIVFFFLDHIHSILIKRASYRKFYEFYLHKMHKKIGKFEKAHSSIGILALFLFVLVPLPLTGVYGGVFLSWILGLERKKSIFAISLGVLGAGVLVYLGTMGVISFLG